MIRVYTVHFGYENKIPIPLNRIINRRVQFGDGNAMNDEIKIITT